MTHIAFIHGLWLSHASWAPWEKFFVDEGFETSAHTWPGEASAPATARTNADSQAGRGIDDLVNHFGGLLPPRETRPIVIGHSFGGLIAQRLLAEDRVDAAVAISPAPIKGVRSLPFAQLRSALPVLSRRSNRERAVALSRRQFRYGFGNAIDREQSDRLWELWSIPSPGRPLFEVASANRDAASPAFVDTSRPDRGPLLMISAGSDHTVPAATTKAAFALYGDSSASTELHEFKGKGHSLTIDNGWRDVADDVLGWLSAKGYMG
ncbi:alpha/beta hydrolase [Antiquaquibacter oligotrophicus]|nr:alpha/beta hydrolase [Antiquaquibacter oligotrophicus]UDF12171.1 alpha/beta hydrolase [Antiquaquibacter oligotrophicus]